MGSGNDWEQLLKIGKWTLIGAVGGWMTVSVICYLNPLLYHSTAVVATSDVPGRELPLSPRRAAQISRLLELKLKLGKPESEIIDKLRRHVRFTSGQGRVEIQVDYTNKEDARDIALEAARLFRGLDEEATFTRRSADLPPMGEKEERLVWDRDKVERLMKDELEAGGQGRSLDQAWRRVCDGDAAAKEVWQSESFQMHWKFHQDATARLIGEPVSAMLPMIEIPQMAKKASFLNVALFVQVGLWSGTLIGLLVGIRRSRSIPALPAEPQRAVQVPLPMPRPTPPVHSPEDEW